LFFVLDLDPKLTSSSGSGSETNNFGQRTKDQSLQSVLN